MVQMASFLNKSSTHMSFKQDITNTFIKGIKEGYDIDVLPSEVLISITKKEFIGDYTIILFPFVKSTKQSPDALGNQIGTYLQQNLLFIKSFNLIKGFLNLEMTDNFWRQQLIEISSIPNYGRSERKGKKVMVEYSSPNTNKPLHLGHIRNILLGSSTAYILDAAGYDVIKTQIINDRGIAICKSMLAWSKYGQDNTPESVGIKSDHFVGDYYVLFEAKFQEEYKVWQDSEVAKNILVEKNVPTDVVSDFFKKYKNEYFNEYSALGKESRELLHKWEGDDPDTILLWKKMNNWVYQGFESTYQKLGVDFHKNYYESETYLLGKETVSEGLSRGVFEQDPDGSVWIDLTDIGMDRKIVLRSDGTAVYMTQDLGTAMLRYKDYGIDKMIYTVADEQNYHFQVLFEILKRLNEPYADGLFHLSYGMVDLTTGKMKSREGTVVDADDLISDVIAEAKENSKERGELTSLTTEDQEEIFRRIGLGALKFFIVKVDPKKRMTFNPSESLDMQGQTGPYIQNAFVRIQSLFRKNDGISDIAIPNEVTIHEPEKELIKLLISYPELVEEAAANYDPSTIANYSYAIAKEYHRFYHELRILGAEKEEEKLFRLALSAQVAGTIASAMKLLGIEMPDRM
jgi:arginyl-tRNA synthetase